MPKATDDPFCLEAGVAGSPSGATTGCRSDVQQSPTIRATLSTATAWSSYSTMPLQASNSQGGMQPEATIGARSSVLPIGVTTSWTNLRGGNDGGKLPASSWGAFRQPEGAETWLLKAVFSRRPVHALVAAVLTLAWAAVVVTPLTFDKSCHGHHPLDGGEYHLYPCFLSVWLAMAYRKLRSLKSRASRWTQYYAIGFFVHAAAFLFWQWLLVACPVDSSSMAVAYVLVRYFAQYLSYLWCQLSLACVSIVRLQWIAQSRAASQASRLMMAASTCCALSIISDAVSTRLQGGAIIVVRSTLSALTLIFYGAFQCRVFSTLLQAARSALEEARRTQQSSKQSRAALLTATAVVLSSGTTAAVFLDNIALKSPREPLSARWWFGHALVFVDLSTDVFLALACSGLITPAADQERNFQLTGKLVESARKRQVLSALKEAARAATGPSLALAALFEGKDPEELLQSAVERFRCVSWDTLCQHPYIITGGGALDGATVSAHLYDLSEPCTLSGCDAFLSHSWHDDPLQKWQSLTAWCTAFCQANGRPPRLWVDKVCIDQANIEIDLQCLPIFLAGCNSLLVCCGRTYTTRLWCCVELFVFMKMAQGFDHEIHVSRIGKDKEDLDTIASAWLTFDVRQCQCFKADDKDRILECIEKNHGAEGFNEYIRSLASDLFQLGTPTTGRQQSEVIVPECSSEVMSI
eukprot:TRINITY_DN27238_c0_g1_i1.p1 TRINITY_DN27238_c0_g1~~TRINITY_DN27238_c0_g1_i1.p1  ORF type:complete len:695 (+),score=29.91 TRINITY_DN27238_c0_g1_i1:287-2371(+)